MCKLIRFVYLVIPIHGFRAFLIKKHLAACDVCQEVWGTDESAQEAFSTPVWIQKEHDMWPQIRDKIHLVEQEEIRSKKGKKAFLFPRWQWGLAGLILLILVGVSLVLDKARVHKPTKGDVSMTLETPQVHIIHAKIHGKKAKPFIYKMQENLFIWFDDSAQEED